MNQLSSIAKDTKKCTNPKHTVGWISVICTRPLPSTKARIGTWPTPPKMPRTSPSHCLTPSKSNCYPEYLTPQISFICSQNLYEWHRMYVLFDSGFFNSTSCLQQTVFSKECQNSTFYSSGLLEATTNPLRSGFHSPALNPSGFVTHLEPGESSRGDAAWLLKLKDNALLAEILVFRALPLPVRNLTIPRLLCWEEA